MKDPQERNAGGGGTASECPELTVHFKEGLVLPIRVGPLRFAVAMRNGLTSHSWGVRTERQGDAYVFCRETMKEVKISLHASGQQHIAFTQESGHTTVSGTRFWNCWTEPPQQRPPIPSLKLLFPDWATTLGHKDVRPGRPKWPDNQILIEGDAEYVTSVWFFVIKEGHSLTHANVPSDTLGILPLRPGMELHVIACKERIPRLKEVVEETVDRIAADMPAKADTLGLLAGLLAGDDPTGCPYVLPILLDSKLHVSDETKGAWAYGMCMKVLVEQGYFKDPESWDDLPAPLRSAWRTIGEEWLRHLPPESKLAKLVADGYVEL